MVCCPSSFAWARTTPSAGAVFTQGQSVSADYACIDQPGGAGLALCQGSVPFGAAIDTGTIGAKTALILAGLYADGPSLIREPYQSRDHS